MLSLGRNLISDQGVKQFSEIFDINVTNLRELKLNWNNISAKGGIYLADSLRNNRHLRFLDIGWNHCGIGVNI